MWQYRKPHLCVVLIIFGCFLGVNSQKSNDDIEKLTAILLRNGFADDEIGDALKVLRPAKSTVDDEPEHRRKRQTGSEASSSDVASGQNEGAPPHGPLAAAPIAAPIRNRNRDLPVDLLGFLTASNSNSQNKRAGTNATSTPIVAGLPGGLPISLPGLPVIDEQRQRKIVEFVGRIFGSLSSLFS